MSNGLVWLTIFVLAVFVGIEVISKVSSTLHTPLMSGANAIHGVILIGAVLVAGSARSTPVLVMALLAVVLAAINISGGFVVTDRMLQMFVRRKPPLPAAQPPAPPTALPTARPTALPTALPAAEPPAPTRPTARNDQQREHP